MTDQLIIAAAIDEIENKRFGTTEQFLKIHELDLEFGKPKVLRVDRHRKDGTAIVYFGVHKQKFYFAVYVDTEPTISVRGIHTENYNSVYFRATSETLDFDQLSSMTTLMPTRGWNKGDLRKTGLSRHSFSAIHFEPNLEPDEFEDKLERLLTFLEQDENGIRELVDKTQACINVQSIFHNGNTMLGGLHIGRSLIRRMSALNLEIDLDLYAEGNFYID